MEDSDEFIAISVKEKDLINNFFIWSPIQTFSGFDIPYNHHVSKIRKKFTCPQGSLERRGILHREKRPDL